VVATLRIIDHLDAGRADLYLLKSIVDDWTDRLATATRCAEAVHPAGRIIVLGGV
jgi:hypothetical protein